jgi:AraC-like DNA-binding protein
MRGLPLERYELFHSAELDYTREAVGRIFTPHRLDLIGTGAQLNAWMRSRRVQDLAINFITYGGDVHIEPGPLRTFFVVQIPVAGRAEIQCGGKRICSTPKVASVISPTEHLQMRWSSDCVQLICRIERSALEAHLSNIIGAPLHEPLKFEPGMDVSRGCGLSWKVGVATLAEELDQPSSVVNYPLAARQLEHGLMSALLVTQPSNYTATINGECPAAPTRAVGIALDLIESHPEWEHTTASLAREAGVSVRALQLGFQHRLDTSAMAYLKAVRLRRVHDALRAAEPDAVTVTEVAARWGFTHPGHFARAYRQQFGENPSQTLRR